MSDSWNDFKITHGGVEGARAAFEKACETLFRKIYVSKNVQQVAVKQGDGGIDILVGNIGVEPIIVIQCKFFIEQFGDSQKDQIRESFKTAINSPSYEMKKWILCIPITLPIDEQTWWSKWKSKTLLANKKNDEFIQLKNGNELIDLIHGYGLYNHIFNKSDSIKIEDIHRALYAPSLVEMTDNEVTSYQTALLKISYLMTKEGVQINLTNKQIFDTLVLVLIYDLTVNRSETITSEDIYTELKKSIKVNLDKNKITATLTRLTKKKLIVSDGGKLYVSNDYSQKMQQSDKGIHDDFHILTQWVLNELGKTIGLELSEEQKEIVKTNVIDSIVGFHKLYAYDVLVENGDITDEQVNSLLLHRSKNNLSKEVSDHLILVLGRLLSNPALKIKPILDKIRKTYLGLQLIGLDPKVNTTRGTTHSGKTYVLDTDFVLNLVATHSQKSPSYRRIIEILLKSSAKIIIPIEILEEVCVHAKYAHRSYQYFSSTNEKLDLDLLLEKVNNVFVESYFNRPQEDLDVTFNVYLRNFYDEKDSLEFIKGYIEDEISENIKYLTLEQNEELASGVDPLRAELQEKILGLTLETEKSGFRDEAENTRIARTDALMYMSFYKKNNHSVITTSTRALKSAKDLGIYRSFYIKPLVILSYMELELSNNLEYKDVSSILFNPFLHYAINDGWDEIKRVIDLGCDLRGTKVTRLKRDLQDITTKILHDENTGEITESDLVVVNELIQKEYRFSGRVNDLIENMNRTRKENEDLRRQVIEYEEKEKKKQKYLKRVRRKP
ncbi:MAG: restriction endonuclease [Gammaproteobacteria bacterium]|nr:restriction endonuclease [Gammaproteobacteria bacterium]